jgi:DNA gyrase subunit A
MEIGTVRQIDIDEEMQGAYLDYAMSVIVARALPDVRDGLKPVHRRILYAMHDMGMRPDRPYKKSARIVGEVLGKYHPHGDAAVYDAMARMAQDFSLRYVLVDGQGNFGSIDGDSPAAMRYTEARMAPIAQEMLADIDKQTVDFIPNFDETLTEPDVLPAALPNLLVNGASGIAVGMTTNIPPHNLAEVCDALVYLIDNHRKLEDVTVEDLTRFIQGPDFPTGGVVYRFAGEDGNGDRVDLIRNAYALGRGRLTVQAHVHLEEMSRNRSRIVVTELPYQVNKTRLIERIAELVRDGRIEGITDLRDESDRQGMRIIMELTRTVDAREVLSQLFKQTPMQCTFGLRMLALVDGEPRLLPLKRVLIHYLEHRQEIATRRSRHLLERAKARAHILEGLLKALDQIDQVIDTIRRSQTSETAQNNLMKRFKLSEVQAQAILDMPLKRLASLERRKIAAEYKERMAEIKYLQELLASPDKIRRVIREDLLALKARYGDVRRTRIVDQEKGHHTARDLVEEEDVLVTLWQAGQVSKTATPPRVSSRAVPLAQTWGNSRDDVAFFTASGQAVLIPLHQLAGDQPTALSSLTTFDEPDKLVSALVLPHPVEDDKPPETYLTLVTRSGRIKRITLEDFSSASRGAVTAMNIEEGDQLAWVAQTSGQHEILLATRQGKAIRFSEGEVRPMGLSAAGVLAIRLGKDDSVVGMGVVRDRAYVVLMTEKGYAKRTAIEAFPAQKRYGGGVQAIRLSNRSGPVATAALASERQNLLLATSKGRATRLPVKAVRSLGRAAAGTKSRDDTKEPYVDSGKNEAPAMLVVLAGTRADAERAQAAVPQETASAESRTAARKRSPRQASKPARATSRRKKASGQGQPAAADTVPAGEKAEPTAQMPLPIPSSPGESKRQTRSRKRSAGRSTSKAKP